MEYVACKRGFWFTTIKLLMIFYEQVCKWEILATIVLNLNKLRNQYKVVFNEGPVVLMDDVLPTAMR